MKTSIRVRGNRPDLVELTRDFGLVSRIIDGITIIEMDLDIQSIPLEIARSRPSLVIESEEIAGRESNLVCGEHGGPLKPYRISREGGLTRAHFIANRIFLFEKDKDISVTKVSAEIKEVWNKRKFISCECLTIKELFTQGTPEQILESKPNLRQPLLAFVEKLSCNCGQLHYIFCDQGKIPCCTCKSKCRGRNAKNH